MEGENSDFREIEDVSVEEVVHAMDELAQLEEDSGDLGSGLANLALSAATDNFVREIEGIGISALVEKVRGIINEKALTPNKCKRMRVAIRATFPQQLAA